MGADHWHICQLLWRPHHHWNTLQVLGTSPQLRLEHLLHHVHIGAGTRIHSHLGVSMEARDGRPVDLWGCLPVLRLGPVVCAVQ